MLFSSLYFGTVHVYKDLRERPRGPRKALADLHQVADSLGRLALVQSRLRPKGLAFEIRVEQLVGFTQADHS